MTPEQLVGVRALAEALPAGTPLPLPRELVLELLGSSAVGPAAAETAPPDLTVADVAERFRRSSSTVRGWILAGRLRSYLFAGREHRITAAALADFEAAERSRSTRGSQGAGSAPGRARTVDLASWRKVAS